MSNSGIKKWTILIYADGNNEMEEIMYKSLLACEKVGSSNDINVVVQIGKLGNYKNNNKDSWSGVRRCYAKNGESVLVEDLGKANMADPNVLYDFIKWGCKNYKAEHFMLVLSDHGGDFIGCFTDLSLDVPYIMGIPEMIEAVNAVRKNLHYIIDILVLDMCYMNCVEILYELGQEEKSAVKTAITYVDYAAYEGISYDKLVFNTQKYSISTDMNLFIRYLIEDQDFNLAAFEINHEKLEKIKLLFSNAAKTIENPLEVINNSNVNLEKVDFVKNINDNLKSIVIYSKKPFYGINVSVNAICEDVGYLIVFYRKLAFSKNNLWTELLSNKDLDKMPVQKDKINVSLKGSSEEKVHYILKFNN
ncbi:clostripain [Clostridium sp. P21]|uniref:Clostripain n=1 Tax=Clostridium muellerianum TaxID=2716538 RepID=A0A7Y0HQQ1_9CLOT|nr:clostripain-related cysteine peptidase [Clostridium muellerianum]NMM64038.1 clostripain [Clostridium muellerianum]